MNTPLVTAIVSTYNAERFIRGCLEDLISQTIFKEIEVLVIDSGSEQSESDICAEFAGRHSQIMVIRTTREPLYAAWNRAIPLARGKYLTNANTDDRHRNNFMELMVAALDSNPTVALVYAEQLISEIENETFIQCTQRSARLRRLPEYAPAELMLRCMTGGQPMWRKSLHSELGAFDLKYRIAADYEMWLRIASKYELLKLPGPLGSVFDSPHTISGSSNWAALSDEILHIQKKYLALQRWRQLPGITSRVAAELFGRGYQHIQRTNDAQSAAPFFREAIRLNPMNLSYLKTYAIRCLFRYRLATQARQSQT
jgi:glycosyltransferase involved in cell wall biosynthesis